MDNLLTTKDICDIFKVRRETITRWKKKGMPYIQIDGSVRFVEKDIEQWIKDNTYSGKE